MTKIYLQEKLKSQAYDFMHNNNAGDLEQLCSEVMKSMSVCDYTGKSDLKVHNIALPVVERKLNNYRYAITENKMPPETLQGAIDAFDILTNLVMISTLPDC